MNEQRKETIQKENRRYRRILLLVCLAAVVVGLLVGIGAVLVQMFDVTSEELFSDLIVLQAAVAVMWLTLIVTIVLNLHFRCQAKTLGVDNGGDWEAAERKLGAAMAVSAIQMVLVFTCFGIGGSQLQLLLWDGGMELGEYLFLLPVIVAGMAVCVIFSSVSQRQIVDQLREQNPEKQGSVYQFNFQKVWLQSCDEAEQLQIYRAGYRAYQAGVYTCLGLWLAVVIANLMGWLRWDSIFLVGVIWLVLQSVYAWNSRTGMPAAAG
ncbi:MAG: DUF3169 family protein [Clostridiales bacterium]|nr:DUF3169 family protein [Clostridiales bacterium]